MYPSSECKLRRRCLSRLHLCHCFLASFPFIVVVIFLSYFTSEHSNSWSPLLKDPPPVISQSKVKRDMDFRRKHLQEACKTKRKRVSWFTLAIIVFRPLKLAFCHVPKTGTTIWTSVYRYISRDLYPSDLKNPFQMRKFHVHHAKMRHFETLDIFHEGPDYLDDSFSILFVRDPYSRLYSIYMEKLFLPDMWNHLGIKIVKWLRPSATERSKLCGNDVTFPEFINFVIQSETKNLNKYDHVSPITSRCHPCGIHYDVIGKDATFSRDVEYSLRTVGLSELVEKFRETDWGERLIRDLVYEGFKMFESFENKQCADVEMLVSRLWRMFEIKGLFEQNAVPPLETGNQHDPIDYVTTEALKQYNKALPTVYSQRKRWRESMKAAWSTVPLEMVKKIREIYKDDFEIFDYNMYPSDIFSQQQLQ